jgi:hypothetical protein
MLPANIVRLTYFVLVVQVCCLISLAVKDWTSLDSIIIIIIIMSGGTLNTWRSGDDGRPVTERLQVRF